MMKKKSSDIAALYGIELLGPHPRARSRGEVFVGECLVPEWLGLSL